MRQRAKEQTMVFWRHKFPQELEYAEPYCKLFTLFNRTLYYCMAFVIALFVLLAPLSISIGYYCIIIVSDCTYTLITNKVMHCDPNQHKPWQVWNVYLPWWLPVQTIFKTAYINIQAALNSNVALQDEDVTTVTFQVKGKKYIYIWFVSIYDSLDGGYTCSVLVTWDAAHKALCCHNIIQPDNRMWGPHHQVVSSWVEWHATDLVCILPHKASTSIGFIPIDNNGTMCWCQDPRMRNHHYTLLWTNQSMTISSLRYILTLRRRNFLLNFSTPYI